MQSKIVGVILAVLGFALLMLFEYSALILPPFGTPEPILTEASTVAEVGHFMNVQFANMPKWVRLWLYFWHYMTFASLIFGITYREAKLYSGALIGNHIILGLGMAFLPPTLVSFKFASLTIWLFFLPVLVVMLRSWRSSSWPTVYRIWVGLAIVQLSISMCFDIPDSLEFLYQALVEYPSS